jgi:hypothetical protein
MANASAAGGGGGGGSMMPMGPTGSRVVFIPATGGT